MKPIRTRAFLGLSIFMAIFMALLMTLVLSCEDVTGSSSSSDGDSSGGGPPACPTDYTENPASKAALKGLIDKYIADSSSVDLSRINISQVTDMSELFKDNTDFNGDIHCWDMSGVTNVNSMFEGATKFNQDLSGWKLKAGVVAKEPAAATKMFYLSGMRPKMLPTTNFYQYTPADKAALQTAIAAEIATAAQGDTADLSIIDTSQVTDMFELFKDELTFNGYIATWDTNQVTTMQNMFTGARAFDQRIGDWDTSSVTNMFGMFNNARAFDQPIGDWNTSGVLNMKGMFAQASVFNQPIGNWKTGSVTDMSDMFSLASSFDKPLKDWDTSKVIDFTTMFANATAFNQDLTLWSNVSMNAGANANMFLGATAMLTTNKATWMP